MVAGEEMTGRDLQGPGKARDEPKEDFSPRIGFWS